MALAILWLALGVVVGLVGWAGASDRLARQHWAGIRLPSTMRSDATWQAAHRAGGPVLLGAGALVGTMGFLLLVFRPDDDVTTLISLFLAVGLLIAVIAASIVGARAANRVTG